MPYSLLHICDSYVTHISLMLEKELLERNDFVLFPSTHHHSNLLPCWKLGAYQILNEYLLRLVKLFRADLDCTVNC